MYKSLALTFIGTLVLGSIIQFFNTKIANHFKLLDIPSARRRHLNPTPVTGGVGVLLSWICGLALFSFLQPAWFVAHMTSVFVLMGGAGVLVILGLIDDLRGLSPFWKLLTESTVSCMTIWLEPQMHDLCIHWSNIAGFSVWPLAVIWIVGITNSINLIDGLDGLASGTSILVLGSIGFLCLATQGPNVETTLVIVVPLCSAILAFFRVNWSNAKIFLGDNGSLPVGYLISTTSLLSHPQTKSWIMIASIALMLGYPILDMGLAVLRRYQKGQPLFKADRNHLHYRILRLGLNVRQTAILLLSIALLLQFSAIGINFLPPTYAAFGIVSTVFSIFTLLHLIYSIETERVKKLFLNLQAGKGIDKVSYSHPAIHIEIRTLLEAGLLEEQNRYKALIDSLYLLIGSLVGKADLLFLSDHEISIVLINEESINHRTEIVASISRKINVFLQLYELQCSLASIPIRMDEVSLIQSQGIFTLKKPKKIEIFRKAA